MFVVDAKLFGRKAAKKEPAIFEILPITTITISYRAVSAGSVDYWLALSTPNAIISGAWWKQKLNLGRDRPVPWPVAR